MLALLLVSLAANAVLGTKWWFDRKEPKEISPIVKEICNSIEEGSKWKYLARREGEMDGFYNSELNLHFSVSTGPEKPAIYRFNGDECQVLKTLTKLEREELGQAIARHELSKVFAKRLEQLDRTIEREEMVEKVKVVKSKMPAMLAEVVSRMG